MTFPTMQELVLRNHNRRFRVESRAIKAILRDLLVRRLGVAGYELGIKLVGARRMAVLNEHFLNHEGPTDVLAFDHTDSQASGLGEAPETKLKLHGEIFVCLDEADDQAGRYGTSWQCEMMRYLVHGILHLLGHDDKSPEPRRRMKREENLLVREMVRDHNLSRLGNKVRICS